MARKSTTIPDDPKDDHIPDLLEIKSQAKKNVLRALKSKPNDGKFALDVLKTIAAGEGWKSGMDQTTGIDPKISIAFLPDIKPAEGAAPVERFAQTVTPDTMIDDPSDADEVDSELDEEEIKSQFDDRMDF